MKYLLITSLFVAIAISEAHGSNGQREETICGALKERFLFLIWSAITPEPDPARITAHPNIEATEFLTGDEKKLRGYKFSAHDESGDAIAPKGYVLMALGNAMIADQMIGELADYAKRGFDAYIYDYRGYGSSDGKRRIKAIIEDYKEIISDLNGRYERKMLYGISFGGIVILNAIGSGLEFDSAVIDSSPSRLSDMGCPSYIDPISHLSESFSSKLLIVTGEQDQVLDSSMTRELREKADQIGARTINGIEFAHPYMDSSNEVHNLRTKLIRDHLLMGN
jgi:hypothetical protein